MGDEKAPRAGYNFQRYDRARKKIIGGVNYSPVQAPIHGSF